MNNVSSTNVSLFANVIRNKETMENYLYDSFGRFKLPYTSLNLGAILRESATGNPTIYRFLEE